MAPIKYPPVFDPDEDDDYVSWKNDVEVWKLYTNEDKKKLGLAIYLSLKGKARDAVRELKPQDLGNDDGYDIVIRKLDSVYLKDETTRAFCAFQEFHSYKRSSGENFSDFIVKWEHLYQKIVRFDMKLPEGVKAYFLLNAANMSPEYDKLARTTVKELNYAEMKDKVMKIFGDPLMTDDNGGVPQVKTESDVLYNRSNQSHVKGAEAGNEDVLFNRQQQSRNRGSRGGFRPSKSRGNGRERRGGNAGWSDDRRAGRYHKENDGYQNPTGSDGNTMKCFACQSTMHFIADCPHRNNYDTPHTAVSDIHITLFNSKPDLIQRNLVAETLGKGLLDSGCSKTVAGEVWLREYLFTLPKGANVTEEESKALFRFGDGIECKGLKCVTIPVIIGDYHCRLKVDIVPNDIPLLISKSTMKSLGMKIDFSDDSVTLQKKKIKLTCTNSGHYCIPINLVNLDENSFSNIVLHTTELVNRSKSEKMDKAKKLHRQFSHASKEKLLKLLKSSKCDDKEFMQCIEKCCDECQLCRQYKKAPLRPAVGLPLADNFNQVVCMDLKEYVHNVKWIFHLLDSATRYSAACMIESKHKNVIVKSIFRIWIAYFGSPLKFLSDNGGEFGNDVFREMNEKLNVETLTTAAESPFSNGIVERHNGILYEAMIKTQKDVGCDAETALCWAVSAKNSLQNHGGFSPNQLVFGHNTNMPTVLTDTIPAFESTTSSEILRKNLEALHTARTKFIEAESSEKIKRALRKKVRSYADVKYENGDKVFYKRKGMKGWRGPANVLGYDGTVVLVRHGTAYYRCHPCHLLKVSQARKVNSSDKNGREDKTDSSKRYQRNIRNVRETGEDTNYSSDSENTATDNESDENSGSEEKEEEQASGETEEEYEERREIIHEESNSS